jgi:isopentenyl phosphate kinase
MKNLKKITLVKLGGSVITDKKVPYVAKTKVIKRLAKELKACPNGLIIAHGSGSFGHTSAALFGGKKGYKTTIGIAKVARDAMEINRIVMNILVNEGLSAISFRPLSMIMTNKGKTASVFFKTLEEALKQGLIPVVYGDVILDEKWKSTIYSGETTLNNIALYLKAKGFVINKIIEVGETNGVINGQKETIGKISKASWLKTKQFIFNPNRVDVTGGMTHKISEALAIAKKGIETLIINGNKTNELSNAILGKQTKGTVIS